MFIKIINLSYLYETQVIDSCGNGNLYEDLSITLEFPVLKKLYTYRLPATVHKNHQSIPLAIDSVGSY